MPSLRAMRACRSRSRASARPRSDLESRTAQLQLGLSPITRGPTNFGWSVNYTFYHIREQVSGFNSTAGDPLDVEWARSGQGPHQISYNLRYRFFNAVQRAAGTARSARAAPSRPSIAGDVNGDGYYNDRAFIFAASGGSDPALAAGMRQLLDNSTGDTRRCLEKQLDRIAERNSCRGPWSSNASLNVSLDRAKFRMPQRGEVTFSLSNPLGAADLLVNGSDDLRGWGQSPSPDAVAALRARLRCADAAIPLRGEPALWCDAAAARDAASARCAHAQPCASIWAPRASVRSWGNSSAMGRSLPGSRMPESLYRSSGANSVLNPMSTILRQQDSLRLTAVQADSIAAMNRRYTYRVDSLWSPVAKHLATLPVDYDDGAAYDRYMTARHAQIDMLTEVVEAVRTLLTPEQRRRLPPAMINYLDPRFLALVRSGNGTFVGGAGGPSFAPIGGMDRVMVEMMAGSMVRF